MNLDEHYLTHKKVTKTYVRLTCSQCPRKFFKMHQLEQHMQFHTVATSSKESTASKRRTVRIKTTLESRDVNDKPSDSVIKTRSGRIVKNVNLFQNEIKVKRKKKFDKVRTTAEYVYQTVVDCYVPMSSNPKLSENFNYMENTFTNVLAITSNSSDDKKQGKSNESGISMFEDGILKAKLNLVKNVKITELSDKLNKKRVATNMHELESRANNAYTATLGTSETFAPGNSSQCVDSSHSADFNSSHSVSKRSQHQNLKSKQCKTPEEEAIQKAHEISLKFDRTLSEKECLNLLDQLDNLVTNFNISDKCPFLYAVIRFCKLYVESHEVKEQAISLLTKITKSKM